MSEKSCSVQSLQRHALYSLWLVYALAKSMQNYAPCRTLLNDYLRALFLKYVKNRGGGYVVFRCWKLWQRGDKLNEREKGSGKASPFWFPTWIARKIELWQMKI